LDLDAAMSEPTTARVLDLAWGVVPERHRELLQEIGADNWQVVSRPLGQVTLDLVTSAGRTPPRRRQREADDDAVGVWLPEMRVVLINEAHRALLGADFTTRKAVLSWVAWHEWGHALSAISRDPHDPTEGERLLNLAPAGMRERIRRGNYSRDQYLHALIADTYALLMQVRVDGGCGRPSWLPEELLQLMSMIGR
jgi:hypothetical protein